MLQKISASNFKLFDETGITINPGRITVLIGPNGTGKSSILQTLILLKQSLRQGRLLTNGPLLKLGAFRDVVHQNDQERKLRLALTASYESFELPDTLAPRLPSSGNMVYQATFGGSQLESNEGRIGDDVAAIEASWTPRNQHISPASLIGMQMTVNLKATNVIANPIALTGGSSDSRDYQEAYEVVAARLDGLFGTVVDLLDRSFVVPAIRGFDQLSYKILNGVTAVDPLEVGGMSEQAQLAANIIGYEPEVAGEVSRRLREVLPTDSPVLRHRLTGTGATQADVVAEVSSGSRSVNLFNEAFGLNQLVAPLLWLVKAPSGAVVGIEEPEIHLHPRAQVALTDVFVDVATSERKQIILTTHSEHILLGLLTAVALGRLRPEELAVYDFRREGPTARADRLDVNHRGQIKGGLREFFNVDREQTEKLIASRFASTPR